MLGCEGAVCFSQKTNRATLKSQLRTIGVPRGLLSWQVNYDRGRSIFFCRRSHFGSLTAIRDWFDSPLAVFRNLLRPREKPGFFYVSHSSRAPRRSSNSTSLPPSSSPPRRFGMIINDRSVADSWPSHGRCFADPWIPEGLKI